MEISILTKHDLEAAEQIWLALEKELHPTSITCRWDLIETWLELYGDVVDYWFIVGSVEDEAAGIMLITKETHRSLPLPVAAYHMGTNGEPFSDAVQIKNGKILVKKGLEKEFYAGILEAITTFKWEEIVLDDFDAEVADGFVAAFRLSSAHGKPGAVKIAIERNECQFMNLAKIRKEGISVLDAFSNDTRYSIRRSIKALGNDISVEWAEDDVQAQDILDELITLYNQNWHKRGKRGMFASERFTRFQYGIIKELFDTGSLLLCRVKSKEYGTLGCIYMLVDDGVAYGYQIGLLDFTDIDLKTINKKRLRVGFIVHALCMQESLDRGIDAYNFGVGDYGYKHELTNEVSKVVSVSIKRGLKPSLRDSIVKLYLKSEVIQKIKAMIRL